MKMPPPQYFVVDQNWPFGTKISHLGPKKPPGTVKSLKWPFWSFSAPGGHWEKRKQIYIMTLVQLFSIYMTSIHPRHLPDTLRHHPDTTQTPPDTIQTPPDTTQTPPAVGILCNIGHRKKGLYLSFMNFYNILQRDLVFIHPRHPEKPSRHHTDTVQTLTRHPQKPSRHP